LFLKFLVWYRDLKAAFVFPRILKIDSASDKRLLELMSKDTFGYLSTDEKVELEQLRARVVRLTLLNARKDVMIQSPEEQGAPKCAST
jgi:hypothetical protein